MESFKPISATLKLNDDAIEEHKIIAEKYWSRPNNVWAYTPRQIAEEHNIEDAHELLKIVNRTSVFTCNNECSESGCNQRYEFSSRSDLDSKKNERFISYHFPLLNREDTDNQDLHFHVSCTIKKLFSEHDYYCKEHGSVIFDRVQDEFNHELEQVHKLVIDLQDQFDKVGFNIVRLGNKTNKFDTFSLVFKNAFQPFPTLTRLETCHVFYKYWARDSNGWQYDLNALSVELGLNVTDIESVIASYIDEKGDRQGYTPFIACKKTYEVLTSRSDYELYNAKSDKEPNRILTPLKIVESFKTCNSQTHFIHLIKNDVGSVENAILFWQTLSSFDSY